MLAPIMVTTLVLTLAVTACGTSSLGPDRGRPQAGTTTNGLPTRGGTSESAAPRSEPTGVLSLPQAAALALARNPELAAFSVEIRARDAGVLHARALPNPTLDGLVEKVGGSGPVRGFRQTESTVLLAQPIELGGKRAARTRVAALGRELARWDYEAKRSEVLGRVAQAFAEMLAAQERTTLTRDIVRLAEQVTNTVAERVSAGKVPPIEDTRAQAALAATRLELDRAVGELEGARYRLAATWGGDRPGFDSVEGTLDRILPLPPSERLRGQLDRNPELARWDTEVELRRAVVTREEANAVPDVKIGAGPRWFSESQDVAFVFGVSVPLPLFYRNEGAIQEARHRLAKAEHERNAARLRLTAALAEAYKDLSIASSEVGTLKTAILPAAESVFETISEGYRLGKFGLLDVLEAQRTFFEARRRLLGALGGYQKALADVERLIHGPFSEAGRE